MPNENLEIDPNDQPETPETPEETPQAPTPGIDTASIQQAIASGNQPVLDAVQQLGQALAMQAQANKPDEPPPQPDELAEKLLTDPKSVLTEEVTQILRDQLARPMARSFEVDRDERVEARAAEIDLEWGEGFFDKNIRDRLVGENGNLLAWSIDRQSDPQVIDSAINAILGNDFRDPEKREEMRESLNKAAKAKAERDVNVPPHMMGPGRPNYTPSDKLTPDHKAMMASFEKNAGVQFTEKEIKEALTSDNTWDPWESVQ